MLATRRYNLRAEPENPSGAPLDVLLEIIAPEATTNLFTNPSWETNTSGWTNTNDGSGGTPYQRTTAYQFKGAYSAQLTVRPTGGSYSQIAGSSSISNGVQYAVSFHVRRPNGGKIHTGNVKAYVNSGLADFDSIAYIADGWWRCVKVFTSTGTTAPGIRVLGSPGAIFYVDACQLEAKGYPTTYADGDEQGLLPVERPPAYYWTGTPHASTSVRSATTRAGGRPMNVARYGLTILALIGLGLSQRSVIATSLGLSDGSLYQRTIRESRVFTIAGSFEGSGPRDLSAKRGALRSLLSHDLSGLDQPAVLRLQRFEQGEPMGDQVTLAASYLEGLGEEMTQPFSENASIQFQQFLPALVSAGSRGTAVAGNTTISNTYRIAGRAANGQWFALSSGFANAGEQVYDIQVAPTGGVLVVGTIPNALLVYDAAANTFTPITVGTVNRANRALYDSAGNLYLGGLFSTAYGVSANNIAFYNGVSWSALGAGVDNAVLALALAPDGSLYVGGYFLNAGGSGANYIARWNGSSWSALGTGLNNVVNSIAIGPDGSVYAGGSFTSPGSRIARWDGSTWSALGTGMSGTVNALAFDGAGNLIAGGDFTTAGGVTVNNIALWNGTAWQAMGAGLNGVVTTVQYNPITNEVIAGGYFTGSGGATFPDRLAKWNGSTWVPLDVDLPGSGGALDRVTALRTTIDGTLYVGFNDAAGIVGTATAPIRSTIANPGTVPTPMTVVITAPTASSSRLYSITNNTTNKTLYLDVTLLPSERATLRYNGGALSFESNFRGSLAGAILPGSDVDALLLRAGDNSITMFADSSNTTFTVSYTPQYESLDDATLTPALR